METRFASEIDAAKRAEGRELPLWFTASGLCAPAAALALFGSLVLRARLVAGEWPRPRSGNPFEGTYQPETIDPGALGLHANLALLAILSLIYLVPLVALMLGVSVFDRRLRQPRALVIFFLVTSALAAFVFLRDPGGYVEWLVD